MPQEGERGTSVVELALILPVFLLIVFGTIEGGRIFSAWLEITNDAREGARYGAVRVGEPDADAALMADVETYVTNRATTVVDATRPFTVTATIGRAEGLVDVPLTVTVSYDLDIITPFIRDLVPNPLSLTARSVMRAE